MVKGKHPMPPFNREFYRKLRKHKSDFQKVDEFIVDLDERGKAFTIKKGQSVRIKTIKKAQIADIALWNAKDYQERFWNDYTLCRESIFLTTYNQLWSNLPMFRPMMTIIEDTVQEKESDTYHHYCIGSHCNPSFWYWALKDKNHPFVTKYNCWCNLQRAIEPFGLGKEDLHDNINLFQRTHINPDGTHPVEPSNAKKGDYVEFYAEIDVLIAISLCPSGTGTYHWSEVEKDTISPLGIEIYDTGFEPLDRDHVIGPKGFTCSDIKNP